MNKEGEPLRAALVFSICGSCWRPNRLIHLVLDLFSSYIILKYLMYTQNKEISWLSIKAKHNIPLILKVKKKIMPLP